MEIKEEKRIGIKKLLTIYSQFTHKSKRKRIYSVNLHENRDR